MQITLPTREPFRTGDAVKHLPSGEKWLVAWCEGGRVCCCGWPESLAPVSECEMHREGTDAECQELLETIAKSDGGGTRPSYARRILAGVVKMPTNEWTETLEKALPRDKYTAIYDLVGVASASRHITSERLKASIAAIMELAETVAKQWRTVDGQIVFIGSEVWCGLPLQKYEVLAMELRGGGWNHREWLEARAASGGTAWIPLYRTFSKCTEEHEAASRRLFNGEFPDFDKVVTAAADMSAAALDAGAVAEVVSSGTCPTCHRSFKGQGSAFFGPACPLGDRCAAAPVGKSVPQ